MIINFFFLLKAHLVIPQLCKLIVQIIELGPEIIPKLILTVNTLSKGQYI